MSREVLEQILKKEADARAIIERAELDAGASFKENEEKITKERKAFYEKLKAERNEKMRRVGMQMNINEEAAKNKAQKVYEYQMDRYEKYFDEAILAAVNIVLKRGEKGADSKDP